MGPSSSGMEMELGDSNEDVDNGLLNKPLVLTLVIWIYTTIILLHISLKHYGYDKYLIALLNSFMLNASHSSWKSY